MNTKLLIIADDLTGGLDTGVQLAKQGITVRVILDADRLEASEEKPVDPGAVSKERTVGPGAVSEQRPAGLWTLSKQNSPQVLVVVSETRHAAPEEAYRIVHRIASIGKGAGIPYVYKKTDSALRGNIGAELAAVLHAYDADVISFLPAYPVMNRITAGGRQFIDGLPAEESVFGQDPFDPVKESDIRKLIQMQADIPDAKILVADAESDADLMAAGRRLLEKGALTVSAGCAGFAACLPKLLGLKREAVPQVPTFGDGLLVISGSLNPITLKQLDHAAAHGFTRIRLAPEEKLGSAVGHGSSKIQMTHEEKPKADRKVISCQKSEGIDPSGQAHTYSHPGKWMILDSSDTAEDKAVMQAYIQEHGLTGQMVRERVSMRLAEAFACFLEEEKGRDLKRAVMVIGGDTLHACLKRLECKMLEPVCELFPGVVVSKCLMGEDELLLISKSGGFGEERLLTDLRVLMEQQSSRRGSEKFPGKDEKEGFE